MALFRLGIVIAFVVTVTVTVAGTASAQSRVEAYVTGGVGQWVHRPGPTGSLLAGAAGMEWLPAPHFGMAGEGGVLTDLDGGLLFSLGVDARVHVRAARESGQWAPYALAGYAPLKLFELSDHGPQFGAGVDYGLSPRRALRIEVRDLLRRSASVASHYWTVRVGLTFR